MSERVDRARPRPAGSRWIRVSWVFLGLAAVAIAVLALTGGGDDEDGGGGSATLQAYEVPSRAMLPTYAAGSTVEVNQSAYVGAEPVAGDVVAFHPPASAGKGAACGARPEAGEPCPRPPEREASRISIERVVAVPGDTVLIKGGVAIVNGDEESAEAELRPCRGAPTCNLPRPIVLGPGQFFVLGDNRQAKDDSRTWGPVPAGWIIGKVE